MVEIPRLSRLLPRRSKASFSASGAAWYYAETGKQVVMVHHSTSQGFSRLARGLMMAGSAVMALSACTATTPSAPVEIAPQSPVVGAPPAPATEPVELAVRGYTPEHMRGQTNIIRVGILLPFSAGSSAARAEAVQILHAAELAVFERAGSNVVLLPKDTAGDADTARGAAEAVIADGADLIIGPLFRDAVAAAGDMARQSDVPMIAFSSDSAVMGDGVYQLSFPPDEEVRRVVEYTAAQGATRYGFIGPATAYGQVTQAAYADAITEFLGEDPLPETVIIEAPAPDDLTDEELEAYVPELIEATFDTGLVSSQFYDGGISAMSEASARLAMLGVEELDPADAALMTGANWTPTAASPFQVVLLPEGGDQLRMLAPVLLYQDIDPLLVKFVGTGLWRDEALAREPALSHGWFAGPDPEARARFESVYESVYGSDPSRLAGLGYDAASLVALLSGETGFEAERLATPDGFSGVDGLFRFREDGTIERGLAVYTVSSRGFRVLDPAPVRFVDDVEDPDLASEADADEKPVNPAF